MDEGRVTYELEKEVERLKRFSRAMLNARLLTCCAHLSENILAYERFDIATKYLEDDLFHKMAEALIKNYSGEIVRRRQTTDYGMKCSLSLYVFSPDELASFIDSLVREAT